jgi:hypothetical protein
MDATSNEGQPTTRSDEENARQAKRVKLNELNADTAKQGIFQHITHLV